MRLMIQPRAQKLEDVAPILAKYASHPPVFLEISSDVFPKGAAEAHAAGTRVLTDVFFSDVGVKNGTGRDVYLGIFAAGADVLQTDLPDEVLLLLGRRITP